MISRVPQCPTFAGCQQFRFESSGVSVWLGACVKPMWPLSAAIPSLPPKLGRPVVLLGFQWGQCLLKFSMQIRLMLFHLHQIIRTVVRNLRSHFQLHQQTVRHHYLAFQGYRKLGQDGKGQVYVLSLFTCPLKRRLLPLGPESVQQLEWEFRFRAGKPCFLPVG